MTRSPTSNFFGFWDWCERTDNGGWGYAADMDAAGWRSNYVRSMTHSDGVGLEEGAYFQVYADNPSGSPGSYDCWNGLLWDFNTGSWDLVIIRCGPDPVHTYYPGITGWSMWEDYNVSFYRCADYDHPGISAEQIQYYTSLGTWSSVADSGVKALFSLAYQIIAGQSVRTTSTSIWSTCGMGIRMQIDSEHRRREVGTNGGIRPRSRAAASIVVALLALWFVAACGATAAPGGPSRQTILVVVGNVDDMSGRAVGNAQVRVTPLNVEQGGAPDTVAWVCWGPLRRGRRLDGLRGSF
jgi:hypothetical protein